MIFMVQFRCALNMMLLYVSAITALDLMTLSLGLGAPGAPKMTPCPLNGQISLIIVPSFISQLFMVQLGCALDMALLWVSVIIYLELMALSLGLGVHEPLK